MIFNCHVFTLTIVIILLPSSSGNEKSRCKEMSPSNKHFVTWYQKFKEVSKVPDDVHAATLDDLYHKALSQSQPYQCKVQKSIGGKWPSNIELEELLKWCKSQGNCETWPQLDGVKKICLDNLHPAINSDSCLVYSFGLADDWTFEEIMAHLGCKVRGFDPTVTSPNEDFSWPRNFIFEKVGISNETKEEFVEDGMYKCETLDNLVTWMNDTGKKMSILKLDIEGYEFRVLPYILRNDMIDDIKQLTLEVHGDNLWDYTKPMLKDMKTMLDVWKIMQSKGFRIVDYSPNLTIERWYSRFNKNYRNFDITFIKQ